MDSSRHPTVSGKTSSSSQHVDSKSLTPAGPDDLRDDAPPRPDQEDIQATVAGTGSTSGWQQGLGSQSSMMAGSQQQKQSQVTNTSQQQQQQQQGQGQQHSQPNGSGATAGLHRSCYQSGFGLSAQGLAAAAEVVAGRLFPAATAVKQKVEDWLEERIASLGYVGQQRPAVRPPLTEVQLLAAALQDSARVLLAAVPNRYGCNNPACTNLATVSDAFALVRGKSCVCGGCLRRLEAGPAASSATGNKAEGLPPARWVHW